MTKTIDLINAIEAGQSLKIHSIFEELVNSRLSAAIEQRRAEIADFVYNGPMDESIELDEEFVDEMSQYDVGDVIEFMMSEEFNTLDELSKTTLGNYVKKASGRQLNRKQIQAAHHADAARHTENGDTPSADAATKKYRSTTRKIVKTVFGINKAVDRLVK